MTAHDTAAARAPEPPPLPRGPRAALPPEVAPYLAWAFMVALFGALTARVGWAAVPVAAFACGVSTAWVGPRVRAAAVGLAAAVGWAVLLAVVLVRSGGGVPRLLGSLTRLGAGAGTGVGGALTLALAFVLAWSAATLGAAAVALVRARRLAAGEGSPGPRGVAAPGAVTLPPRHPADAPHVASPAAPRPAVGPAAAGPSAAAPP